MSTKKEKLHESAQKYLAKGQLDRAIKEFQQIVDLDPGDIRFRQRLAELLVKCGRKAEAIGEYTQIGKHYADNLFYLKAIAVYKQIQKLDPDNISITLTLASLNEKQGLVGNALAEYGTALAYYQTAGQVPEAIRVLEQMLAADPENLNTHLRFAETYYTAEVFEKSYEKFKDLAALLHRTGDADMFEQICKRVAVLFPDRKTFIQEVSGVGTEPEETGTSIEDMARAAEDDPGNLDVWMQLADAYLQAGVVGQYRKTLETLTVNLPDNPVPWERLFLSLLEERDFHRAAELLGGAAPVFVAANRKGDLEKFADEVLLAVPGDSGIVRSLLPVFRFSGNRQRLDELTGLLPSPPDKPQGTPDDDKDASESGTDDDLAEPELELSWDEDVNLSFEEADARPSIPYVQSNVAPPVAGGREVAGEGGGESENGWLSGETGFPTRETDETPPWEPVQELVEMELDLDLDLSEDAFVPPSFGIDSAPRDADSPREEVDQAAFGDDDFDIPVEIDLEADFPELELPDFSLYEDMEAPSEELISPGADPANLADDGPEDVYGLDPFFSRFLESDAGESCGDEAENRYNLGIAYKEMGLYDNAVQEFEAAAVSPVRRGDCLILLGICALERGDADRAEALFRKSVKLESLSSDARLCLTYELASILEQKGSGEEALELFQKVAVLDPTFRDVARKVALLAGSGVVEEPDDIDLLELAEE